MPGNRVKDRLEDLSVTGRKSGQSGPVCLQSKKKGTEKRNYGRYCGILTINGGDVGKNPNF